MRQIWNFIKTTLIGGLVFLLPIAATIVVVMKFSEVAVKAVAPIAKRLPFAESEAIIIVYASATLLCLLLAFVAGLIARSLPTHINISPMIEKHITKFFPPYALLRKYTDRLAGIETNENLKPALVLVNNVWQLGFVVDTFGNDYVTVFMPSAPDPSSGVVQIIGIGNISPLDVSRQDALACLKRSGRGLPGLLSRSSLNK
ncbi:MAG: hypothetical protein WB816_16095 [Methylocystis sp.]